MQRWMEAKMQLARKHGATKSNPGMFGAVREDWNAPMREADMFKPVGEKRARHVIRKPASERSKPWNAKGRVAYPAR